MGVLNIIPDKNENQNNINFELKSKVKKFQTIRKIKEINGGKIVIFIGYNNYIEISDIKTAGRVCVIEINFKEEKRTRYYDNILEDLIELKNKDLIFWSNGKIFYYKKFGDNYKISQIIDEVKQQRNETKLCKIGRVEIYNLYNVIELENNNLLSCNSIGIKIYKYQENEYKFIKVIPMFLDVKNLIHIKDNDYLVIHHYTYNSGGCFIDSYHEFALSLFDSKTNNKIFYQKTERDIGERTDYRFNYFLIGDNFIYQICVFPYDLERFNEYRKEKNILSSNYNLYNIKTKKNIMDLKTSFRFISYFKDNLIYAQDYYNLYICNFENNVFTPVYKFNFNCCNLCSLKNNDFIIYEKKTIWKEYQNNDGKTCRYSIGANYYYNYYKYKFK